MTHPTAPTTSCNAHRAAGGPVRRVAAAALAMCLVAVAAGVTAHAATLGGVESAGLFSITQSSVSVPHPAPLHFPFTAPGTLHGATETNGWTWTVHTGAYTSAGSVLTAGTTRSVATVDTGSARRHIVAHIAAANGNRSGGVAANVNAAGTQFVAAINENQGAGRVRLVAVNGATITQLATIPGGPVLRMLGLRFTGTAWVVSINGVDAFTHVATPAQLALLGANTRFGLFNNANAAPTYTAVEFP